MGDLLKEEFFKINGNGLGESDYWDWVNERRLMSGPMSGNDIHSVELYIKNRNYLSLTPNAIKVLFHCLYFGGKING